MWIEKLLMVAGAVFTFIACYLISDNENGALFGMTIYVGIYAIGIIDSKTRGIK